MNIDIRWKKWVKIALFIGSVFFISDTIHRNIDKKKQSEKRHLRHETLAKLIDKKTFKDKLRKDPPGWMKEQIAEDFKDFTERGVSKRQVDETFAVTRKNYPHPWIIRYRIINNELYRYFPKDEPVSLADNPVEKALKTLLHYSNFKDLDFILSYIDGVPLPDMPKEFYFTSSKELQAPILFSAKVKNTPYIVLVPDWRSVSEWWASDIKTVLGKMGEKQWEHKKETAVWRGSLTKAIRLTLCQLSVQYPQYLDAKLNLKSDDPVLQEKIEKEGLFGNRVSWDEFLDYKYLPIVDGVCCAAPALQWRLLSNSLTLKQESDEIQWFYRAIEPYTHYIPIKNDLSDIIEKMQWAKTHDPLCKEIAEHSTNFVLNHLMMEDVYLYFYLVMKQYSALQDLDKKEIITEVKEDSKWVNIQHRNKLKKRAIKENWPNCISTGTPY